MDDDTNRGPTLRVAAATSGYPEEPRGTSQVRATNLRRAERVADINRDVGAIRMMGQTADPWRRGSAEFVLSKLCRFCHRKQAAEFLRDETLRYPFMASTITDVSD